MTEQVERVYFGGAWERNGVNGPFFTGNLKKTEIIEKINSLPGDEITMYVSKVDVKQQENSPDVKVTLAKKFVAEKQG